MDQAHAFPFARGVTRLAFQAVAEATHIVEGMHANIAAGALPVGRGTDGRARGVAGLVYGAVRGVTRVAGAAVDPLLSLADGPPLPQPQSDAARSVLNGVLGDHLETSGNPLAIPMQLRRNGVALPLERTRLRRALPDASPRLLVLVHGLCMNDRQWQREGHDHGAALERDLGVTPVYLHYNTGRPIRENGRDLAARLEALVASWPVPLEEIAIVGHSMGGRVARCACDQAVREQQAWLARLRRLVFLGTPHDGAPLERAGALAEGLGAHSPYLAPLLRMARMRSAGIMDLRHPERAPVPDGVGCYVAAGSIRAPGRLGGALVGDGLVPVASALGRSPEPGVSLPIPASRRFVADGVGHIALLGAPVYPVLRRWLEE